MVSNLSVTSLGFFIFTLSALVLYYRFFKGSQNLILLSCSWLFCLTWGYSFLAPLIIYSIFNYIVALKINSSTTQKKQLFWLGIILNVCGLIFYKHLDIVIRIIIKALTLVELPYELPINNFTLIQPIGISFYTLQAISYLVDVYRGQIQANKNFTEVALYLSYFPKLIAGPLERAGNFFEQLKSHQEVNNTEIIRGTIKILIGLIRKIVIAETILEIIPTTVLLKPSSYSTPDVLVWWSLFIFVIYNDFAGYTNIAQGVSKLFGIELSQNFQQPLHSTSFIEFWNRWHISLSNWLRDYIYLPVSRWMLYRNPNGKHIPNLLIPPLVTMLISGLWHGVDFNFILWGVLNGLLQGIERVQRSRKKYKETKQNNFKNLFGIISMFFVLAIINMPFKFNNTETFAIWKELLTWNNTVFYISIQELTKPILAIGLSFFIDFYQTPNNDEEKIIHTKNKFQVFVLAFMMLLLFLATRQQTLTPFIYQEF